MGAKRLREKLYEYGMIIGESKIHLKSDSEEAIQGTVKAIKYHRQELVDYIRVHPEFQYALKPVKIPLNAPRIVRVMAESSKTANVGPMASVAGSIADLGLEAMLSNGAETAIVEDGGEIAAFTRRPISITILSGSSKISGKIGFYITRDDCPLGVATSSSKTDRVISFGEADSVTVVAENASLADAAATAICNFVKGSDVEKSIRLGLERSKDIKGVRGVIIIRDGNVGLTGDLPKILKMK